VAAAAASVRRRRRRQRMAETANGPSGGERTGTRPGAGAERRSRRRRSGPAAAAEAALAAHPVLSPVVPARYFDTKTTEPISFFLSGLEELLAWQPNSDDEFNVSAVPLAKRQPPLHSRRPRTLVCHDMRGGYMEDRHIHHGVDRRGEAV
uniref:Uncharacterized protein n=1 Tax=Malurus cyaneus samueli TaxID=2593467 RepID=A0A8C5X982_9PASS